MLAELSAKLSARTVWWHAHVHDDGRGMDANTSQGADQLHHAEHTW
jgi:hypothetical protein